MGYDHSQNHKVNRNKYITENCCCRHPVFIMVRVYLTASRLIKKLICASLKFQINRFFILKSEQAVRVNAADTAGQFFLGFQVGGALNHDALGLG